MNYHNIIHDDLRNGPGIRTTLFVSGCSHKCKGCQNPQTWDCNSGIPFDKSAREELFNSLGKDYTTGITFSGGDPFYLTNVKEIAHLINEIESNYCDKTIMVYTGFTYQELHDHALALHLYNALVHTLEEIESVKYIFRRDNLESNEHIKYFLDKFNLEPNPENYALIDEWAYYVSWILLNIDSFVDGRFEEDLLDVNYKWAGSTNQHVWLNFADFIREDLSKLLEG